MRIAISLMLFCCSANAAMYSCLDNNGAKTLRSTPCDQDEKQKEIVKEVVPSYATINSTGERMDLSKPEVVKKSPQNSHVTQANSSSLSLYDRAMSEANSGNDQRPEMRAGRFNAVIRAYEAENCKPEIAQGSPLPNPSMPSPSIVNPQSPSVITSCDGGGCWDNLGGRYNKGAGNTYFGPNGACQNVGGMMQCP